ncbi:hypothetical protein F383_36613 [Gossypium arboreum]|nr:hypothetical protein F383_36613 [Gossypium arboreum]
MNNVTNQ